MNMNFYMTVLALVTLVAGCGKTFTWAASSSSTADAGNTESSGGSGGNDTGAGGFGGASSTSSSTPASSSSNSSSSSSNSSSSSSGSTVPSCSHTPCAAGGPLAPECGFYVELVCNDDNPFYHKCCTTEWDGWCAAYYFQLQGIPGAGCGLDDNTCPHSLCETGAPLPGGEHDACNNFVFGMCNSATYAHCCQSGWGPDCVAEAQALCTWDPTVCTCL